MLASSSCSQPCKRLCGVNVADGDGECVGGICGFGQLFEIEQTGHHELYLFFFGEAIAYDAGFDFERGVFGYGHACGGGGEQGYAADLAELERAFGVDGVEDFFDGDYVGLPAGELDHEFAMHLGEALGEGPGFGETDAAEGAADEPGLTRALVGFDYAEAGNLCAAIDAEDAHFGQCIAVGCLNFCLVMERHFSEEYSLRHSMIVAWR